MKNAAKPQGVKAATRADKDAARRRHEAYKAVLATPAGRAVIWDLLSGTGMYQTPFSTEALVMAHRAGSGDVGRKLLAYLLREHSEHYLLMEQEARVTATARQRLDAAIDTADESDEGSPNA